MAAGHGKQLRGRGRNVGIQGTHSIFLHPHLWREDMGPAHIIQHPHPYRVALSSRHVCYGGQMYTSQSNPDPGVPTVLHEYELHHWDISWSRGCHS